uniref:ATP synthase subunit a n=1 Tax=Heterometrus longimanus TaxID=1719223 RepID=A0A0U2NDC5_9SCOR|nr:ATP synthase F0 subunit 6 [Heterometrus longimanus]
MVNLFAVFDPVAFWGLSLNWVSIFFGVLFIPMVYWFVPSRWYKMCGSVFNGVGLEVSSVFSSKWGGVVFLLCCLFSFIFFNNFLGLFPYVFTASSHVLFTLCLALPIWMSLMIFGWLNKSVMMFAHLVPVGTPTMLMGFMVCIESVSNIIRPITLSVRLAANMIAGHLLIVLMGSVISGNFFIILVGMIGLSLLLVLELAVAFIQAYVFTVLSALYVAEI